MRGGSSFAWVKTHTYRKTVAKVLDQSCASTRMIADQLGHSRVSMTQDVYLGRRAANTGNLAALEAYDPGPATSGAPTRRTNENHSSPHLSTRAPLEASGIMRSSLTSVGGPPGDRTPTRGLKVRCSAS